MAEPSASREVGWLQVLSVAALVVALILGAVLLTSVLPEPVQRLVFHTPLAILVLIGGTAWLLWRISRRSSL